MKVLATISAVLFFSSLCFSQIHLESLGKARGIKLLSADRETVRKAFEQFTPDESDDSDDFEAVDADIEVRYSTGSCDEDEREVWNVAKGKAVSIEIRPNGDFKLSDFGFDLSSFTKEQTLVDVEDEFVFHDKSKGIAISVNDDVVEEIILFPPTNSKAKACKHKEAKEFISHKSWFGSTKLEDRKIVCINIPAEVTDLVVSQREVSGTTAKEIQVTTTGTDPENDVLTYSYNVTGGKVIGTGAKVPGICEGYRPAHIQ